MEFRDNNGTILKVGDKVKRVRVLGIFKRKVKGKFSTIVGTRAGDIIVDGSNLAWGAYNFEKIRYCKGARYAV